MTDTPSTDIHVPLAEPRRARLALGAAMLLCLVGIGIALDLTHVFVLSHTDPDYQSFCAVSEGMNCETVALSRWSTFWGVPNSIWGVAGYLFALILTGITVFRRSPGPGAGLLFLLAVAMNVVSLWLVYVMHFLIGSLCILCLALDAVNLGILVLAVVASRARGNGLGRAVVDDLLSLLRRPVLLVVLALAGFGALAGAKVWGDRHLAMNRISVQADGRAHHEVGPSPHSGEWAKAKKTPGEGQCPSQVAPSDGPRFGVSADGHPWVGGDAPEIEIHEFTDYQCPHCRQAHMLARKLVGADPRIRIYHRHLPLDMACNPAILRPFHGRACELSRVAVCAGKQGRFWEMNDFLFQHAEEIRTRDLSAEDIARRLELDQDTFRCCMDDPEATAIVGRDLAEANEMKLRGTPAFLIDGKVHYGKIPPEALSRLDAGALDAGALEP